MGSEGEREEIQMRMSTCVTRLGQKCLAPCLWKGQLGIKLPSLIQEPLEKGGV